MNHPSECLACGDVPVHAQIPKSGSLLRQGAPLLRATREYDDPIEKRQWQAADFAHDSEHIAAASQVLTPSCLAPTLAPTPGASPTPYTLYLITHTVPEPWSVSNTLAAHLFLWHWC